MTTIHLDEKQIAEALADYVRKHHGRGLINYRLYKQGGTFEGLSYYLDKAEIQTRTLAKGET
jgi:hypothetical protein